MKKQINYSKLNSLLKKFYPFVIICIVVFSIIPILLISKYNHPSADDFGYSQNIHFAVQNNASFIQIIDIAVKSSKEYMQSWQGLYTSAFLLALQPAAFNEQYYGLTAFIMLAIIAFGVFSLSHSIANNVFEYKSKKIFILGLIVFLYIIQCMPVPVEGLFWFNGAMNYLFFWGLMLFNCSLLIRFFYKKNAYISLFFSIVLSFLISGGNHITAFINILVCIIFSGYCIFKRKKIIVFLSGLSGILGFLINLTSPGTAIRMESDGINNSIIKTIIRCGYEALVCHTHFFTFSFLLMLLVLTPFIFNIIDAGNNKVKFKGINCFILLLIDYILISAMYCVPYYAMGNFGEGRVFDTIYATYIVIFTITYGYILGYIKTCSFTKDFIIKCENASKKPQISLTLMLCSISIIAYIAIIGGGIKDYSVGFKALTDLGEAKAYHLEYQKRLELLYDDSKQDLFLEKFSTKPYLLFFADIDNDSSHWSNKSMATYYNKNTISLK